ncbi:checkpoint protein Rad24 [Agrocybe pediades]|nr:checkpoint protein Rad24 [Agrocybe pediades]
MPSLKGKGKAKELDDSLWVDKYEPTTEAQLAVHVRKVEDVRRWLNEAFEGGPSGKLTKYRRVLALTGPAGTGKTTTIKVLAKEMDFEILEWRNAIAETLSDFTADDSSLDYEGMFYKFETFLTRASSCQNIFAPSSSQARRRRIILLEDIPNILHARTQAQFHEALNSLALSHPSDPPVPIVIIVSDAGIRGEAGDERRADGGGWGREKSQVVDIRTVLSKDLLCGPYVTEISFNPIAPTLLRKALQAMLNVHFSSKNRNSAKLPSKDVLDAIVDSANGDIRSAIMALQFACVMDISGKKKKNGQGGSAAVLGAVTRREQSLALFHLLGKVLYNKRKGDPPAPSASAKDLQKERNLDAALKDSTKLPSHLLHHERRTSRVDVDALYADSPIESSLFSLYIHQNYTQFCNEMEEVEGVSDWLSWVDSSGGEMWYQANPHQFHLVTLGTLHSLPSPVPRRSQKQYKPEFFAFLQKEKDAWEGVRATRDWLVENEVSQERPGWRPGGWTKNEVILELGGVLKTREATRDPKTKPPALHKSFSRMEFSRAQSSVRSQQLDEKDVETNGDVDCDLDMLAPSNKEEKGSWLESDDIEEF